MGYVRRYFYQIVGVEMLTWLPLNSSFLPIFLNYQGALGFGQPRIVFLLNVSLGLSA
jgi:hypothetical protein